jgi:hypothetical protein
MSAMDTFHAPTRPAIPFHGPELVQLASWLDFYRATLLEKCDGLSGAQLKERPIVTSRLSLLGIVRHMTFVEQQWFETSFSGRETTAYYKSAADRDLDFNDLDGESVENVVALFERTLEVSRAVVAEHGLDEVTANPSRGRYVDLRWVLIHMIEEYARHCGHADLIRELIDGVTGY